MNHWIVIVEDSPEMLAVHEKHFADHVSYLTGSLKSLWTEPRCPLPKGKSQLVVCGS